MSEHDDPRAAPVPLPFLHGRYDVTPGMTRLAAPAGSNAGFFVLGPNARAYLGEKLRILTAHGGRHRGAMPGAGEAAVAHVLWETLLALGAEHPGWLERTARGLVAHPLGLRYALAARAPEGGLRVGRCAAAAPGWEALSQGVERWLRAQGGLTQLADCVALSMQEDYAVVRAGGAARVGDDVTDALEYVHVCFPSHWDPRQKLGGHFAAVHAPVANNAVLLKAHPNIVQAMVAKGPFLRHAWGIARDGRLDHHPEASGGGLDLYPPPKPPSTREPAYLRVERQTTRGFPTCGRALFTIRTYVLPLSELRRDPVASRALAAALRGMDAAARRYKGLVDDCDELADWLDGDRPDSAVAPASPVG